jgi:thioredoxin-related protein
MLVLLLCVSLTSFYLPEKKKIWQSWNDIMQLSQKEKKPILIDIYTDWCVYCKKMDAGVYKNDSVLNYLEQNYYRFKFNAESKDTLVWRNKKFGFHKIYKVHEFVQYLTQGAVVFPTTVVIPPDGQPFALGGELKTKELETILKYFTTAYPDKNFQDFEKEYKPRWK